jgi:hypothetical protein
MSFAPGRSVTFAAPSRRVPLASRMRADIAPSAWTFTCTVTGSCRRTPGGTTIASTHASRSTAGAAGTVKTRTFSAWSLGSIRHRSPRVWTPSVTSTRRRSCPAPNPAVAARNACSMSVAPCDRTSARSLDDTATDATSSTDATRCGRSAKTRTRASAGRWRASIVRIQSSERFRNSGETLRDTSSAYTTETPSPRPDTRGCAAANSSNTTTIDRNTVATTRRRGR